MSHTLVLENLPPARWSTVADPGFPVGGGVDLEGAGVDS